MQWKAEVSKSEQAVRERALAFKIMIKKINKEATKRKFVLLCDGGCASPGLGKSAKPYTYNMAAKTVNKRASIVNLENQWVTFFGIGGSSFLPAARASSSSTSM